MKSITSFVTLSILLSSLFVFSSEIKLFDNSFAQSDDENNNQSNNNVIGQDGEGNEASQIEENSQETNQDSMCISGGDSIANCNNLASSDIGQGEQGEQGEQGPEGPQGPPGPPGPGFEPAIYIVEGETETNEEGANFAVAEASCEEGDFLTGGSSRADGVDLQFDLIAHSEIPQDENTLQVVVVGNTDDAGEVVAQAFAYCMDLDP